MEDVIARVSRMEVYFDALLEGRDWPEALEALKAYMDSGTWLRDYQLDEQGLLPKELKRGVLSEDGLYNLLCG